MNGSSMETEGSLTQLLGRRVRITLVDGWVEGLLHSVDHFLNLVVEACETSEGAMRVCVIRGGSIVALVEK
ncbi:LSM domain-containing protein [Giardia muris]|uniref:LSM domain-containing protein n=1 Tax=Giardia muris TaxID=5742 RepID=A0A4Z1T7Z9_GIAMU|nr:LSM domain-containing protein [Giardia muris]|eukprot:TNJ29287.1 LSM domain-containing protein [Giardia muris]